jgi:hypothetical protein
MIYSSTEEKPPVLVHAPISTFLVMLTLFFKNNTSHDERGEQRTKMMLPQGMTQQTRAQGKA